MQRLVWLALFVLLVTPSSYADELYPLDMDSFALCVEGGGGIQMWANGEFTADGMPMLPPDDTILFDFGELGEEWRESSFPIDPAAEIVVIFVSAQLLTEVELVDPSGKTITAAQSGIEVWRTRYMKQFQLTRATPGRWKVRTQGRGLFMCSINCSVERGSSTDAIELDFEFVNNSDLEHDPYPEPGTQKRARVELDGHVKTARLELVTQRGTPLASYPLPVRPVTDPDDYESLERLVLCTVPRQSFRARVVGIDANGHAYQRTEANFFRHPSDSSTPEEPPMSNAELLPTLSEKVRNEIFQSLSREERLAVLDELATHEDKQMLGWFAESLLDLKPDDEVLKRFTRVHLRFGGGVLMTRHMDVSQYRWMMSAQRYLLDHYDSYDAAQKKAVHNTFGLKDEAFTKEAALSQLAEWKKAIDELEKAEEQARQNQPR